MRLKDTVDNVLNCSYWKLRKNWTIKWLLDMGYQEGDCECCRFFEDCQYLEELRKVKKNENN